jgi:hypothetical protein
MWQIDDYHPHHIDWAIILNISCIFYYLNNQDDIGKTLTPRADNTPGGLISCPFVYVERICWLMIEVDDDRCTLQVLLTDAERC